MHNSVEVKVRKTVAELARKNVEKISVSALCEKAGISRASFYLYYNDIDDLIEKTLEYIVDKFGEQLGIILDVENRPYEDKYHIVFSEDDIALLGAFTGTHVYWKFALHANNVIVPRFRKRMIEFFGEETYRKKEMVFEFLINGGAATLYFDLLNYDKETYIKNMQRIAEITKDLLSD